MAEIVITVAFFFFSLGFLAFLITTAVQIFREKRAIPYTAAMFVFAFLALGCVVIGTFGEEIFGKDDNAARNQVEDINTDSMEPEEQQPDMMPISNTSPDENEPIADEGETVDIKIMLDGKEISPVDILGNPADPFVIDGSTYLPVRAVASALGLDVEWDAETNTVILTSQENEPQSANGSA